MAHGNLPLYLRRLDVAWGRGCREQFAIAKKAMGSGACFFRPVLPEPARILIPEKFLLDVRNKAATREEWVRPLCVRMLLSLGRTFYANSNGG